MPLNHQSSTVSEQTANGNHDDDDDADPEERDPSGRFARYGQRVGKGRFKCVYKAFDEKQGIDVAWSKVLQEHNNLDDAQMKLIVDEMSKGLNLDHTNVIKCYRCWLDPQDHCINLITEFFTSGNLRDYRQRHKHFELRAVKKWARQVLQGLNYLHSKEPAIIHGDLRCDKIYVNGHSGEIKIGDLGLATLLPMRFAPGVLPEQAGNGKANQYTRQVDVFAFGLVVLELVTAKRMDHSHSTSWPSLLDSVKDEDAKVFIAKCLGPEDERPSVAQLLVDDFFKKAPAPLPRPGSVSGDDHTRNLIGGLVGAGGGSGDIVHHARNGSSGAGSPTADGRRNSGEKADVGGNLHGGRDGDGSGKVTEDDARRLQDESRDDEGPCQVGKVEGEDYTFRVTGKPAVQKPGEDPPAEGELTMELHMQYDGNEDEDSQDEGGEKRMSQTVEFNFNPEEDTADDIAQDLGDEFNLSPTDRDICAAALKEWLGRGGNH
mmetsp:Transcript_2738/g.8068  ORF Transcript_2738/g.8068 Transcript_2738/m.8068 type:complete len:488 (-) Transcript_2738:415-1878(-)